MNILIVEDDTNSRILLERELLSQGYAVDSTANGVEALTRATLSPPDLIVSDIMMPEMDGFELCRRIKTDERLRAIPFVFYTATFIEPKDEQLAMSLGASRFLVKPMAPEDLFKAIKEIIEEHREKRLAVPEQPLAGLEELTAMQAEAIARKLDKKVRELEQEREALRQAEARLRLLIQTIPDLIWLKDQNGVYLTCNPRCERLLGAKEPKVIGKTDYDFHSKELADFFRQKDREAIAAGKSCINTETVTFASDGHMEILETIKTPMFDDQGQLIGVLGIAHDITAMRQAQKQLRESEERFRQAMEFLPIPIGLANAHGVVLYVNSEFSNRYGYTKEDIPSLATWALHAYPDPAYREASMAQWNDDIAQVVRTGTATPGREYRIVCKGGEQRQVEIVTRPVGDFYVTALNDITDRLALENQLHQAQKMEAIGQLAGGVAHDFNNILTAIIGYSSLMQMTMGADDPNRRDIQQVLDAANRAAVLTQSLLVFSRKQVIKLEKVDLGEVVAKFEKFLRRLIREDIEFKVRLTEHKLPVVADHGQIEQVLMNLVTNARDAMPKGGRIMVETASIMIDPQFIKAHGFGLPGEYAVLMITDTGEGIPETIKSKIFDPFFTTKEQGKGTGLGLSMVYGIVQKHNGYIKVYSEPATGSTFKIYLPLAGLESEVIKQEVETQSTIRGGNETILIAEDDASIRNLGVTLLRNYGYKVIEATDGKDAVIKFMENRNDIALVVLDGIMPKMNGKEAWQQIRALEPKIKAIFVSGYAEDIFTTEGIPNEGGVFIQKPTSPQVLLQKIRELLDNGDTETNRA